MLQQHTLQALEHEWKHKNPQEVPKVSSKSKWIVKLSCKDGDQRFGYFTIGAVDAKESALACFRCSPKKNKPSNLEKEAYSRIQYLQKSILPMARYIGLWVCEARVIPSIPRTAVDVYFIDLNLILQLDGKQHFEGGMYGLASQEYKQRDNTMDEAAWCAGFRMLRVHYMDIADFDTYFMDAVERCTQQLGQPFIMYTSHWPIANRHTASQVTR